MLVGNGLMAGTLEDAGRVGLPQSGALTADTGLFRNISGERAVLQVLVVDDDEPMRKACSEIAGRMGCAVVQAESVPAAQAILKYQKIFLKTF